MRFSHVGLSTNPHSTYNSPHIAVRHFITEAEYLEYIVENYISTKTKFITKATLGLKQTCNWFLFKSM